MNEIAYKLTKNADGTLFSESVEVRVCFDDGDTALSAEMSEAVVKQIESVKTATLKATESWGATFQPATTFKRETPSEAQKKFISDLVRMQGGNGWEMLKLLMLDMGYSPEEAGDIDCISAKDASPIIEGLKKTAVKKQNRNPAPKKQSRY